MAVTRLHPDSAQSKPASLLDIGDALCEVRHLVECVAMMASDLDDGDQTSAFIRLAQVIKDRLRAVETDIDAIRAAA